MNMKRIIVILLLSLCSVPLQANSAEATNAGKLVGYFLRDILGGIVGLKGSQGNPQEAAQSLKQVLHGAAHIIETVLEDAKTRGSVITEEQVELLFKYIQTLVIHSLESEEGQRALNLFLEKLNLLEK